MDGTTHTDWLRELAYRENDGIEVTLFWNERDDRVFVWVVDTKLCDAFELEAAPHKALDLFYHPYPYRPVEVSRTPALAA